MSGATTPTNGDRPIFVPPREVDFDEFWTQYRAGGEADDTAGSANTSTEVPTWRTLADVSDDPPRPLLLGLLEPDGPTLFYAAPGTGKGTTGAWIVVELQRLGMTPVIYDAERRPREWARRVSGTLSGTRFPTARTVHVGHPVGDRTAAVGNERGTCREPRAGQGSGDTDD
jgi:hypothetical protein